MPQVVLFDVNETLLDLAALDPLFRDAFGDEAARVQWFDQLLQTALVTTVTGRYVDFSAIGRAALQVVAARRGADLGDEQRERILDGLRRLPAHDDVRPAIERLRAAGLRVAALTNSPLQAARERLAHAGVDDLFEQVLSADSVRRLKPAPEPYLHAAERLGVPTSEILLVAAHSWDMAGAANAGCATAYVARPGKALDPLVPRPAIVAADLIEVAERVVAGRAREVGAHA